MRKYFLLFLSIAVLGIGAWLTLIRSNSTMRVRPTAFAVERPEMLTRIEIISRDDTSVLQLEEMQWLVNNKEADRKRVNDLLTISGLIQVVAPISENIADSLSSQYSGGVEVKFFEGKKRTQSFHLCHWKHQVFARKKHSERSFRIAVMGYPKIDLTRVFNPSPDAWESYLLMQYSPEDIVQIKILYPGNEEKNFILSASADGTFKLQGQNRGSEEVLIDPELASEYLSSFSGIKYIPLPDSQKNNVSVMKDLRTLFILEIVTAQQGALKLEGYELHDKPNPYYFYAKDAEYGYIQLNYNDFDPILISPDYFLKK
jgi:hypothetical protein